MIITLAALPFAETTTWSTQAMHAARMKALEEEAAAMQVLSMAVL